MLTNQCPAISEAGTNRCSLPLGHDGLHIARSLGGDATFTWGTRPHLDDSHVQRLLARVADDLACLINNDTSGRIVHRIQDHAAIDFAETPPNGTPGETTLMIRLRDGRAIRMRLEYVEK